MKKLFTLFKNEILEDQKRYKYGYKSRSGIKKFIAFFGYYGIVFLLPWVVVSRICIDLICLDLNRSQKTIKSQKPQLKNLILFADNLPISWGKIVKTSAADYEDRINELWGAGKYRSAKWNQKLAWLCALSNLGHYLWLKVWKPVSTVFRRLL